MTLKELAHLAQQTLQDRAGCAVKRSHVHELLAAAFGHRSWAAFLNESVLADAGVGSAPTGGLPELIGRAVQLCYGQQAAATVATSLAAFIAEHQLSPVSWADLRATLLPAASVDGRDEFDEHDDDDENWDDEPPTAAPTAAGPAREQLMRSPMLLSTLEQAAGPANPQGHFLLAALYRCNRPNPYLYEESLKGRVLTTIERGWVDDYLRLEAQYRKYEAHLKAAAQGGVRAVLQQARRVLSQRVRHGATMSSPQAVKDYLRVQIGVLEHEVFMVVFLDAQHRLIALKEMFRGTVTQTSVYPREVAKEPLALNAAAVILAHSVARHRMRLMCPEPLCVVRRLTL